MLHTEIANLMEEKGKMFEWAEKVEYNQRLTDEEKEISQVVDAWAKEIGRMGKDPNNEIASYIIRTIEPQVYDAPDELLDLMFDRGNIGEFDDVKSIIEPKNTLVAYEAAKGGTVDKSYIDLTSAYPTWKHLQIDTEIPYADLRRNGFKSIAKLTVFAEEALKNKMFFNIFSAIDAMITSGSEQYISAGSSLTQTAMDALALYIMDRGTNPITVSLSKYAQQIARMEGQSSFMSDDMKNEFNRYGLMRFYGGVRIGYISGGRKTGDNQLLLPDKRIFGIADKIGTLDMKGELRVLEDFDNQAEKVNLKITGFEYGTCITRPENIAKIVLS